MSTNAVSIGIADDGCDGEVKFYGKIDNDMNQLDSFIRKLISKGLCSDLYTKLVSADMEYIVI